MENESLEKRNEDLHRQVEIQRGRSAQLLSSKQSVEEDFIKLQQQLESMNQQLGERQRRPKLLKGLDYAKVSQSKSSEQSPKRDSSYEAKVEQNIHRSQQNLHDILKATFSRLSPTAQDGNVIKGTTVAKRSHSVNSDSLIVIGEGIDILDGSIIRLRSSVKRSQSPRPPIELIKALAKETSPTAFKNKQMTQQKMRQGNSLSPTSLKNKKLRATQ